MTDSLVDPMIRDGHSFYAGEMKGQRYDTGDPLEYLKTVVDFGLRNTELGTDFKAFLETRLR